MWHVAEGDLHAYLDGALEFYPRREARRIRAHLDRCESCRRRLEEESALMEAAREVLAAAAPAAVSAPPFESLRRRAEERAPAAPARRARAGAHRAWAAAVALALGVGWAVGARLQGPEQALQPEDRSAAAMDDGPALPLGPGAGAERAPAGGSQPGPGSEPEPERQPEAGPEPGFGPAFQPSQTDSRFAATPSVPTPAPLRAEADEVGGGTQPPRAAELAGIERRPPPVPRPVAPPVTTPTHDALLAMASRMEPLVAALPAAGAGDLEADPERGSGRARSEAPGRPVEASPGARPATSALASARDIALGAVLDLFRGGSRAVPLPPSSVDARGRPDASRTVSAPLSLPGLPVEAVEWTEVTAGEQGIRVLHRLEDGTPVELRFLGAWQTGQASGAPLPSSLRTPLPAGWSEVERPFRGGWVLIRGPLPEARLRALLQTAAAGAGGS